MAKDLVADVRLRGVERPAAMPDVLRAVENAEGQTSEEVTRREQARDRAKREARTVWGLKLHF